MRLPLIGGSYSARSIIANCQRCINLFPENNPKDAPVPVTHYQRPGLRVLASDGTGDNVVRCLYRASNGNGYCVIGTSVYSISASWVLTKLGDITAGRTNPVSMIDNGTEILIVDGSANGWIITLATNAFAQLVDATGLFQGGTRSDIIDTFILTNVPGTNAYISTLSNTVTYDPTYLARKTDYPDPIQTIIVCRHEILLIGALKSEIWFDAGNTGFPFAELPGAYIEHGTVAPYSIAAADISSFWLGQDLQGQGVVFRQRGYETRRISTHAIEYSLQLAVAAGATLTDAIGYTYQQGGHVFYVLCLPSADLTWVWDEATEYWHQRCWTDADGNLHRDRSNCCAFINGLNVVGDWENGTIYALDQAVYQDNGLPISFIRTFPHLLAGVNARGEAVTSDGKLVKHERFRLDAECGTTLAAADGTPPQFALRWSDDRGKTYGNAVLQTAGALGEYLTQAQWPGLGIARDRVYEISFSFNGPCALNGAWIEGTVGEQ